MGITAAILDAVTGAPLGDGPVTATAWEYVERLDRAGEGTLTLPVREPRAALVAQWRGVRVRFPGAEYNQEVAEHIVTSIETAPGDGGTITASGPNRAGELAWRTVGSLTVGELGWPCPAPFYQHTPHDGTNRSLDGALDGNPATAESVTLQPRLHPEWSLLYFGSVTPIHAISLAISSVNTQGTGARWQYFDGEGWYDMPVVDGTAVGGVPFAQSGNVTWPTLAHAPVSHNGMVQFWVRCFVEADHPGISFWIAEARIHALVETTSGPAQIIAKAPGWTVSSGTTTKALLAFEGESVLEALARLAEQTGEHWRLGSGRAIEWLGTAQPDSQIVAMSSPSREAGDAPPGVAIIPAGGLRKRLDATMSANRLYAYSAGSGAGRGTLAASTIQPPAGMTINRAANYVELQRPVGEPLIEAVETFSDIGGGKDDLLEARLDTARANQLARAAFARLAARSPSYVAYDLRLANLPRVRVGERLLVIYHEGREGAPPLRIREWLVVLEVRLRAEAGGAITADLVVASAPRWPLSEVDLLAGAIGSMKRREQHAQPLPAAAIRPAVAATVYNVLFSNAGGKPSLGGGEVEERLDRIEGALRALGFAQ